MDRILIVRLGAMGDVLHALPAVAALRKVRPQATIGWVVEQRWLDLLYANDAPPDDRPLVDVVHTVNTKGWRNALLSDRTWREVGTALQNVRMAKYDAALDLQGSMKSAFAARLSGAAAIYGYAQPRERAATVFYTKRVPVKRTHVVEQAHELAAAFVEESFPLPDPALPRSQAAEAWCDELLRSIGERAFAILNPGAGWGAKCWPTERYREVVRALADANLYTLVNAGPGEEPLAQAVLQGSAETGQGVQCSVAQLIALTRRAKLVIGGDTGPLHLAAALKVPVVALFGPTDPDRNGPYGTRAAVLRHVSSATSYSHARTCDPGLESITAGEVIAAARSLLAKVGA